MARRIFAALLLFATIAVAAGCKRASPLPPNVSRLLAELRSPDLQRRQDAAVALGSPSDAARSDRSSSGGSENRGSSANKDKLGPREAVRHPGRNSFSNVAPEFAFSIWNANDPKCCPTGGQVVGYLQDHQGNGRIFRRGDARVRIWCNHQEQTATRAPTTMLKMVVDTAVREPMPRPVKRTQ
jgi:hypothetical protein